MRRKPPASPHHVAHVSWPELTGENPFDDGPEGLLDRDDEIVRETHRAVERRSWLDTSLDDAA